MRLIIALIEPHVEKALSNGDTNGAMALQSIISTINLALETGAPVQFRQRTTDHLVSDPRSARAGAAVAPIRKITDWR